MTLHVVGGTYDEICIDPPWHELFGSGLRAAYAVSKMGNNIVFHTSIGVEDYDNLLCMTKSMGIDLISSKIEYTSSFKYDYPLANPEFYIPEFNSNPIIVNEELVLQFGMIEGNSIVHAKKTVYDPQAPGDPQSFWANGSTTDELIWVSNYKEAELFTGGSSFNEIKEYLFKIEKVHSAIIKRGSDGATLIQKDKADFDIPIFKTKSVWPIGTGDIFSSSFAYYYLIANCPIEQSAMKASLATAYYSETTSLPLPLEISETNYEKFSKASSLKQGKVYIAGPFFTMQQRWMIVQLRKQLINFGLKVFSPFHDVGLGIADVVAALDVQAIKGSDIIVALLDGVDPGTLFEIGYARALDIPVIVFNENEKDQSLTMMKGSGCIIESDFSSLIYKTVWEAYK